MVKIRFSATLNEVSEGDAHISVKGEGKGNEHIINTFLPELYVAIFKAMKETKKSAFYEAMLNFVNEDFNDAMEFITGENEND